MERSLDEILQSFTSFSMLQSVGQVLRKLEESGVTLEEFYEWIKEKGNRVVPSPPSLTKAKHIPWSEVPRVKVLRKCPECGKLLGLAEVNTTPDSQVSDESKCQWYCPLGCKGCKSKGCGWEEYSTKSIWEEAFPYMVRV